MLLESRAAEEGDATFEVSLRGAGQTEGQGFKWANIYPELAPLPVFSAKQE